MTTPLLTICLVTYNRSEALDLALQNIFKERAGLEALVEVLIVDNASSDGTASVVQRWLEESNTRYVRRPKNIGASNTILDSPRSYSAGKYTWVVGDDDLILANGLKIIVGLIRQHPDLSFFLFNQAHFGLDQRNHLIRSGDYSRFTPAAEAYYYSREFASRRMASLAGALEMGNGEFEMFSHVMCIVFETEAWRNYKLTNEPFNPATTFSCVEDCYPHTVMMLRLAKGKPVYYHGQAVFCGSAGHQDYCNEKWLKLCYHCWDLIALYKDAGVSGRYLDLLEKKWIMKWTPSTVFLVKGWINHDDRDFCGFLLRSLGHPVTLVSSLVPHIPALIRLMLPTRCKDALKALKAWFGRRAWMRP